MAGKAPLINRASSQQMAYISQPLLTLGGEAGFINAQQFMLHVHNLAAVLPEHRYVINLCGNRYLVMLVLCAAVLKEQTNLLPPNKNIATQQRLHERYPDCYVIHDGIEIEPSLPQLDLSLLDLSGASDDFCVPDIALDHLAAISFTSGSTGDAKPNCKTWHTLTASTDINQRYMLPNEGTCYQLATVPGQHMWGLETSVLMALFADVCVVDAKPLFPQDIQRLLSNLPVPRMLVSTPVHLRALVASDIDYAGVATVLCATSPLTKDLAEQVEARFCADLREVYGCSEVGSMAVRTTAHSDVWQRFEGIDFAEQAEKTIIASAAHVPEEITLGDHIEVVDKQHFRLAGRTSDMVDIAGKRGSLHEINTVLLSFPGLVDGIVFFPPQQRAVPRLVALVVLPTGTDKNALSAHFRNFLDSAFVPRPIIVVDALPREDNGKLPHKKLLEFYLSLQAGKS
ncbi:MAG: AMP-binding protein [Arenicella sp.]